jgi:hypothetical protein
VECGMCNVRSLYRAGSLMIEWGGVGCIDLALVNEEMNLRFP